MGKFFKKDVYQCEYSNRNAEITFIFRYYMLQNILLLRSLTLLSFLTPFCMSIIQSKCYPNGGFIIPSIDSYSNMSSSLCQCLAYNRNYSVYQYDEANKRCFIHQNGLQPSDLRIQFNSTVCFLNQTSMVIIVRNRTK